MNVRFRFTKDGETQYVGHLDLMRYFQKAIKRAGIDIAYSKGFNPHQILSFASPLGIGYTSTGEYFDAEINTFSGTDELLKRINDVMVPGIRVLDVKVLPDEGRFNAMASLKAASYMFIFSPQLYDELLSGRDINKLINDFMSQKEIVIHHVTKKREKDLDILPLILKAYPTNQAVDFLLAAGSSETVKPLSVIDAFLKYCGLEYDAQDLFCKGEINIMRIDQYTFDENEKLISLSEVGKTI